LESIAPLEGDRALERFGHVGLPAVWSRTQLAWSLAERGEFEEGLVHGEEAVRIAIGVGHQFSRVVSGLGLGVLRLMRGELEQAIAVLEPCHQLSETVSLAAGSLYISPFLGLAYVRSGRHEKGLPLLQAAIEFTESRKLLLYQAARMSALGEAYLDGGRVAEAVDCSRRALDLARRHQERGHEAHALLLRAEIAAAHPEFADADSAETYQQALAIATELGMRPLIADCHLGLGKLYSRVAQLREAHEQLTAAIMMYRRLGMRLSLERAEIEMSALK
jgi:tetratricopeptide (TPR) repeat protein